MNYFKKCICAQSDSGNFLVLCDRSTLVDFSSLKPLKIDLYKLNLITRDLVINFPSDLDDESIFKFIRINQGELRLIDNGFGFKWGFGLIDHRFNDPDGPVLVAVSELFLPIDQFIESNPSDFNKFVNLDKGKQEYLKSKEDNNSTTINIDDHLSFSNDAVDDIRGYVDSSIQTLENSISNNIADVKDNVSRIEENNNIITKRIEESINIITKNIKLLTIYLILIAALVVILIFAVKYISTHTVKEDNTAISSNDITTATDTLSKCPICGSEANVHISYNSSDGTKYCSINCSNIYCGLSIEYQNAEEAFKKWNSLQYND